MGQSPYEDLPEPKCDLRGKAVCTRRVTCWKEHRIQDQEAWMSALRQPLSSGEIIITIIAPLIQYLLQGRPCTKSFTCIMAVDPHNKPMRLIVSPFYGRLSVFPKITLCGRVRTCELLCPGPTLLH